MFGNGLGEHFLVRPKPRITVQLANMAPRLELGKTKLRIRPLYHKKLVQ